MGKEHGPAIVAIGGGHGLSAVLRGLKNRTDDLTAIVTVADDGGGSGTLREELGMPPPGDIRNCMEALANAEPLMRELMQTSYYPIRLSTDVMAVESAVALKNAYALGVALAIGLSEKYNGVGSKPHYNSQAAMFYQGVTEIRKLLLYLTGSDEQIDTAAGDMYVTVFGGRTRLIGTLLGRGYTIDKALEELKGVTLESLVIIGRINRAIKRLAADGKLDARDFPLLMHMDAIIEGKATSEQSPWTSFTE